MKEKIVKIMIWSISSIISLFIGWQALLITNVYMAKRTARMMIGREYYMHDYYYADISNITYTGYNFLLYVQKPFLFSPKHHYLYISKDGIVWKRVFTSVFSGIDGDDHDQRFGKQQVFNENVDIYGFSVMGHVDGYWQYPRNFPNYHGLSCSILYEKNSYKISVVSSENCATGWLRKHINMQDVATNYLESYPDINVKSFNILKNIIQKNKLKISLGVSRTTYGNGKYVGIFSEINKYYLIISSDGVHYEIKKLPSDITSSLAISVFGK